MRITRNHLAILASASVGIASFVVSPFANSAQADLFVSNYTGSTIEKFTAGGVGSFFANTLMTNPYGVAFDSAGNLYVAAGSEVEKFTPGGVGSVFASGLANPIGLAFDSAGNLYAASNTTSQITKITPGGSHSLFATVAGTGMKGLAFDSAGNLFAADAIGASWSIEKITLGGVASVFATGAIVDGHDSLHNTYGLGFDSRGNLFAANSGNNTVYKFAPNGTPSLFASTGLNDPLGLAIDTSDNAYVANFNDNTIEKFTPGGAGSVFANSGLNGPAFLAFETAAVSAVPEPSTATMMLSLGIVGFAAAGWRRRNCNR